MLLETNDLKEHNFQSSRNIRSYRIFHSITDKHYFHFFVFIYFLLSTDFLSKDVHRFIFIDVKSIHLSRHKQTSLISILFMIFLLFWNRHFFESCYWFFSITQFSGWRFFLNYVTQVLIILTTLSDTFNLYQDPPYQTGLNTYPLWFYLRMAKFLLNRNFLATPRPSLVIFSKNALRKLKKALISNFLHQNPWTSPSFHPSVTLMAPWVSSKSLLLTKDVISGWLHIMLANNIELNYPFSRHLNRFLNNNNKYSILPFIASWSHSKLLHN